MMTQTTQCITNCSICIYVHINCTAQATNYTLKRIVMVSQHWAAQPTLIALSRKTERILCLVHRPEPLTTERCSTCALNVKRNATSMHLCIVKIQGNLQCPPSITSTHHNDKYIYIYIYTHIYIYIYNPTNTQNAKHNEYTT
jgi:hypothetical protein